MTQREPSVAVAPRLAVIGASLAGLFAAAAAHRAGWAVTVLERDDVPDEATVRPGVPQGTQPHVFLCRGMRAAEQLLPGLTTDLAAAGAVRIATGQLPWLGESGWSPLGGHGFDISSASRPLLELVVRRRVRALSGVGLRGGQRVDGMHRRPGSPGARAGWVLETSAGEAVPAEVVIDASGRSSRLPHRLAGLGVGQAPVSSMDAQIGYATRVYRGEGTGVVVQATPEAPRGGLALPIEGGRWLVCVVGYGGDRPPRDAGAFTAYLRGLRDPALADQAERWTPLGDVAIHRQTANVWHHYEDVTDWPAGVLAVGDALCAFNPVYGQGITVAACQAELLVGGLAAGPALAADAARTRRLQRAMAGVAAFPWAVATGADVRFPASGGRQTRSQALLSAWARQLGVLSAHGNLRAAAALSHTYHLVGSPWALFHPALFAAVLRGVVRGYGPLNPRPAVLAAATEPVPGNWDQPA
jgi:2-polyprenyl-6-methoxyphenol hydroxylase-like FAD-dependent oxidoreductase